MYKNVPFKKEHLLVLLEQKENEYLKPAFPESLLLKMEASGTYQTGMIDGTPMVCGGYHEHWPGRAEVLTVFNMESKACFVPVFRGIKKFLDEAPVDRIEISVPCEFKKGIRRAKLLGFEIETMLAKKYLPGGIDCCLFARVK